MQSDLVGMHCFVSAQLSLTPHGFSGYEAVTMFVSQAEKAETDLSVAMEDCTALGIVAIHSYVSPRWIQVGTYIHYRGGVSNAYIPY